MNYFKDKENLHSKLKSAIRMLLLYDDYIFYGNFALELSYKEREDIKTCAVSVNISGYNFFYNSSFLDRLNQEEVNFIVIHELFHLLFNHHKRTENLKADFKVSNIVQDMIINSTIVSELSNKYIKSPLAEDGSNMGLFIPIEYKGDYIYESLYKWFIGMKERKKNGESFERKDNLPNGKGINNKPIDCISLDKILEDANTKGVTCEYIDEHIEDEISDELKSEIIKETIEKIRSKVNVSSSLEDFIDRIQKRKVDYLKVIKKELSNITAGTSKYSTYQRPNRRNIFGLKGKKKKNLMINCILDTSGSMLGEFDFILGFIFQNELSINMIQCDTKVHMFDGRNYKTLSSMGDFKKQDIKGGGGTVIMPAVNIIKTELNNYNTVILTDGYTDTLDFKGIKGKVLILTTRKECNYINSRKVKQIKIDNI